MTYCDKTWCVAHCKADGSCGRKLTEKDKAIIEDGNWFVSFADFSDVCSKYDPEEERVVEDN
jgi:hypothetical protein